jgi:hypothetical protein
MLAVMPALNFPAKPINRFLMRLWLQVWFCHTGAKMVLAVVVKPL